jgi:predicted glycosyltransferase
VKALFYVQHLLGIGHLMRAGILASAMEKLGIRVTLVSGGAQVPVLRTEASRFEQLPPARAMDEHFKVIVDEHDRPIDDDWKCRRRDRLLALLERECPHILLLELYPFGRRLMRFELDPLLERAREMRDASGTPLIAASVRDILVPPTRAQSSDGIIERARRYLDMVIVHGDPGLVRVEDSFPRLGEIHDLIHYSGYVVRSTPPRQRSDTPGRDEVIVSTGGGAASGELLAATVESRAMTRLAGHTWRVLIGHNYPEKDFRAFTNGVPEGVVVERARSDFGQLLANGVLSISQAGYNTVMEVLQAGIPAVMLPYAAGGETEQALRCRALAERGAIHVVEKGDVSAERVARAIEQALDGGRPGLAGINMDGAMGSARLLYDAATTRPV